MPSPDEAENLVGYARIHNLSANDDLIKCHQGEGYDSNHHSNRMAGGQYRACHCYTHARKSDRD